MKRDTATVEYLLYQKRRGVSNLIYNGVNEIASVSDLAFESSYYLVANIDMIGYDPIQTEEVYSASMIKLLRKKASDLLLLQN